VELCWMRPLFNKINRLMALVSLTKLPLKGIERPSKQVALWFGRGRWGHCLSRAERRPPPVVFNCPSSNALERVA
jgi:hypothetical protein